ncbi:hypothetical protein LPJ75_005068, partial [Coemansia sp. RSA 2598]
HFSRYGLDDAGISESEDDGDGDGDGERDGGQKALTPAARALASQQQQQQGFGKATASPVTSGAQSQMGGSSAVANKNIGENKLLNKLQRQPISNPFDGVVAVTAAVKPVEPFSDLDSGEETASISASSVDGDASFVAPPAPAIVRPPKQLLLGGRRAESLRRGPVMRASLFAPAVPTSKRALAESLVADAARDAAGQQDASAVDDESSAQGGSDLGSDLGSADSFSSSSGMSGVQRRSSNALDLPPPSKYLRTNETRVARERLLESRPYAASLSHGRSGMSADAGLMMARSFRAGFGHQGQLVYLASSGPKRGGVASIVVDSIARHIHAAPGGLGPIARDQLLHVSSGHSSTTGLAIAADSDMVDDSETVASSSVTLASLLDAQRALHVSTAMAQWQHALVLPPGPIDASRDKHAQRCAPSVAFRPDTTIASVVDSMLSQEQQQRPGMADAAVVSAYERQILELAAALFDDLPAVDPTLSREQAARVRSVRRRQALTRWLMAAVYDAVQHDLLRAGQSKSPAAAAVFALLSGHRVDAACLAAASHRDYRLATLVAQSGAGAVGGGGNDKQVRQLLRAQLERFVAMGTNRD